MNIGWIFQLSIELIQLSFIRIELDEIIHSLQMRFQI